MGARVDFLVNDREVVSLGPGAVIGRTRTAALHLNDPGISEAHALVSLRGSALRLLSLRGRFSVGGQRVGDVALTVGLAIELAPRVVIEVTEIALPPTVLGISVAGGPTFLPPPVCSLFVARDEPVVGVVAGADAILWLSDEVFHLRLPEGPDLALAAGETFSLGGRAFRIAALPLAETEVAATQNHAGFASPLELVVRYDTVHVRRGGIGSAIDGIPARILSELALIDAPVEWQLVAREVWPEEDDAKRLRMNWDAGIARLRLRLRELGVRADLVRPAGHGRIELFLGPEDRVTDAS